MRTYPGTYVTGTGSGRKSLVKKHYHEMPLEIVYEDNYLVVINKPAGMLSVPGKRRNRLCLSTYKNTLSRYHRSSDSPPIGYGYFRCVINSQNKEVHQHLQAQFKNRMIKKRYIALLDGKISSKEGTIILPSVWILLTDPDK